MTHQASLQLQVYATLSQPANRDSFDRTREGRTGNPNTTHLGETTQEGTVAPQDKDSRSVRKKTLLYNYWALWSFVDYVVIFIFPVI